MSTVSVGASQMPISTDSNPVIQGTSTLSATWEWHEDTEFSTVHLAGLSSPDNMANPLFDLVAEKVPAAWFSTWQLQLRSGCTQNTITAPIELTKFGPGDAAILKAVLSYHPQAQLVSVALYNLKTNQTVYATTLPCTASVDKVVPTKLMSVSGGPSLQQLLVESGYQPIGDQFDVGEYLPDGIFISLRSLARNGIGTIVINSPLPAPGAYRVALIWPQAGDGQSVGRQPRVQELAYISPNKKGNRVDFPLSELPPGATTLKIDYIEAGNVRTVFSEQLTIGKVNAVLALAGTNEERNAITGALRTEVAGTLPGVNLEVLAQYQHIEWDASTSSYRETPWENEQQILSLPVDSLTTAKPYTLSVPLPSQPGNWKLSARVKVTPEVTTTFSASEEFVSNISNLPDNWVAITDQTSTGISVFDPAVKDWSTPEARKWSWTPTTKLGYSYLEMSRLTGPADVKLRNNNLWGGQWVGVVGGGLATVAAYPSGTRKWATFIESGANPHSIELLPSGNVAVAASNGGWVRVYSASQGPNSGTYTEYQLPGAHGVLWDPKMELLWTVGDYLLVGLKITGPDSKPVLTEAIRSQLPTPWGHDLSPVYGDTNRLWVTSGSQVYQYLKSSNKWLSGYIDASQINMAGVKSVNNQPSGQVVLAHPKAGTLYEWTTDTIDFFAPRESRTVKGISFYKARVWNPEYQ